MKLQITKIKNLESPRSGRAAPNQHQVEGFVHYGDADNLPMLTKSFRAFQSYDSMICRVEGDDVILDETYWDYSRTTSKYLGQFLGEPMLEVRKKVKNGTYILEDLNNA